jgi:glycosyltransferase involved in cell wall biosynthesis
VYSLSEKKSVRGGRRLRGLTPFDCDASPTVSVITAVFNAQGSMAACIESVLQQDYPSIEYIVIDAVSTDGTIDVIRRYDDRIDIWISEPDKGIFDAWNKGLDLARGEWIAFLGADDAFVPGAIRRYTEIEAQLPLAEFLSSKAQLIHPTGYSPIFGGPWKWPACARLMTTIHVGTLHKRSLFERYGRFDTYYRIAGDYEFLLRAGGQLKAGFLPELTVMMRSGGASDSTAGLYEARHAKIQRRVRSPTLATLDLLFLIPRFYIRKLLLALFRKHLRIVKRMLHGPTLDQ